MPVPKNVTVQSTLSSHDKFITVTIHQDQVDWCCMKYILSVSKITHVVMKKRNSWIYQCYGKFLVEEIYVTV
jgi:hypothetical protein